MPLSVGECLGPYEILGLIGAGGMGEVYRARDTKLDRDVAIKVLPAAVARDPERLARFEREAKVLAALNHPNIASIYRLEDRAIVMELVEGPTLAERIQAGPREVKEALGIAFAIADALEAAHDKGVVHRDLKPANVKAPPEGTVKVLDLGLATALPGADRDAWDPANSPTLTMGVTEAGVILGTAAYMSPEQASGKRVDRRADIWSFGVVLWEMLTGKRLFDGGETLSHTLADVLRADIDFARLPAATPVRVRELLARCLDRDVKTRLRDIGEARVAIQRWLANPAPEVEAAPSPSRPGWISRGGWIAAGVLAVIAGVALWLWLRPAPPEPRTVVRFANTLAVANVEGNLALSRDGSRLAFVGSPQQQIYVRMLDQLEARPMAGTEGARSPSFSPDGQWISFITSGRASEVGRGSAQNRLKKIALAGGPPQTLADAPSGPAVQNWGEDDSILVVNWFEELRRRVPLSN